jgi:hypothetical protein
MCATLAPEANPFTLLPMKKWIALILLMAVLGGTFTGCCHKPSGSREFRPGQGWVPND